MSRENVEVVRSLMPPDGSDLVALFGNADALPVTGLVAPDATVRFVAENAEMSGVGREGFFEKWADWLSPWQSYRMFTEEPVDRDDRVTVRVHMRGVTKHGGVEMEHDGVGTFRFEDGLVVEIEFALGSEPPSAG